MTRKELLKLMPVTGDDLPGATRVVEMGYPGVAPVMRDMVKMMRIAESSVADAFAAFFGRLGEPAVPVIAKGLSWGNCFVRHRIICQVLSEWPPEIIRQLARTLTMVATQPDAYDNDLRSLAILARHGLVDPELKRWVEFKRERLAVRNELLMQVEKQLNDIH